MGSTCETEVKTEEGPTRFPIWTCAIPAIPSTNEVTFVHSRLVLPAPPWPCPIRWPPGHLAWPEPRYLIGSGRWPWLLREVYRVLHRVCFCQVVLATAQDRPLRGRGLPRKASDLFRTALGLCERSSSGAPWPQWRIGGSKPKNDTG